MDVRGYAGKLSVKKDGFQACAMVRGLCLTENCLSYPKTFKCIIVKSTKLAHHAHLLVT